MQTHPELGEQVAERLTELELAGEVSDELIARLRQEAGVEDERRHQANWRLGRALQKRAKSILVEAADAFRAVAESSSCVPKPFWVRRYGVLI